MSESEKEGGTERRRERPGERRTGRRGERRKERQSEPAPPAPGRGLQLLFALLALAAIAAAVFAFQRSLASAYNNQAMRYELHWQKRSGPSSLQQWGKALDWSTRTIALDDTNPYIYLRRARILSWYGSLPDADNEQYFENLDEALQAIETAIALHPNSGEGYSSRAALMAQRGELGEPLNSDIVRSLELGPWERDIYLRALNAGLFNWPRLEDETRAALRRYFDLSVNEKPGVAREMFDLADRYGRTPVLCTRLEYLQSAKLTEFKARQCPSKL